MSISQLYDPATQKALGIGSGAGAGVEGEPSTFIAVDPLTSVVLQGKNTWAYNSGWWGQLSLLGSSVVGGDPRVRQWVLAAADYNIPAGSLIFACGYYPTLNDTADSKTKYLTIASCPADNIINITFQEPPNTVSQQGVFWFALP